MIVCVPSRNPRKARGLPSEQRTSIVGAHWQRLPSFKQIGAIFVEKLAKTYCTKRGEKRQIFRSFLEVPEHLTPGSGDKLQPTGVLCASWCIVSQKTKPLTHIGVWKLYKKCAF